MNRDSGDHPDGDHSLTCSPQKSQDLGRVMALVLFQHAGGLGAEQPARFVQNRQGRIAEILDPVQVDQVAVQRLPRLFADIDQQQDIALGQDLFDLGIGLRKERAGGGTRGTSCRRTSAGCSCFPTRPSSPRQRSAPSHRPRDHRCPVRASALVRSRQDRGQQHQCRGQDQPEDLLAFQSVEFHRVYLQENLNLVKDPGKIRQPELRLKTKAGSRKPIKPAGMPAAIDGKQRGLSDLQSQSGRTEAEMTEKIYHHDSYCREARQRSAAGKRERAFPHPPRPHDLLPRRRRPARRPGHHQRPAAAGAGQRRTTTSSMCWSGTPARARPALRLDFPRRYDHMQQHTAQHLLSQVLLRLFDAPTLSFAIGPEHSSIEIGRPALE